MEYRDYTAVCFPQSFEREPSVTLTFVFLALGEGQGGLCQQKHTQLAEDPSEHGHGQPPMPRLLQEVHWTGGGGNAGFSGWLRHFLH